MRADGEERLVERLGTGLGAFAELPEHSVVEPDAIVLDLEVKDLVDLVFTRACAEHEDVPAIATVQDIAPEAAPKSVIAKAAAQDIVAIAAVERIVAAFAIDLVDAVIAEDDVVAIASRQSVVTREPDDRIGSDRPGQGIRPGRAG